MPSELVSLYVDQLRVFLGCGFTLGQAAGKITRAEGFAYNELARDALKEAVELLKSQPQGDANAKQ